MSLTLDLMAAFVRCRYTAFLKCTGQTGVLTDYEQLDKELADEHRGKAISWLVQHFTPSEILFSPPSLDDALVGHNRLILNAPCDSERGAINFPAIEHVISSPTSRKHNYALVVFSHNTKLSREEKSTAALLGAALSNWHSIPVPYVKMIHGPDFLSTKLMLLGATAPTRLGKASTAVLHDLETMVAQRNAPPMYLNSHCGICEYRDRCHNEAIQRDDLSLLRGLQPKEIEAWKKRGIFTVTQLAYTFRAKTMGRSCHQPKRHSQPLQAMAIRDKKTYVRKRPELPTHPTRVFFDVEGIPERDLFYLIGVVVMKDGIATTNHLWADDESQQEAMWRSFLGLLAGLGDYVLIHFGRYERDFIREMQRRYGATNPDPTSRLFDVHAAIRTNVFFPVYSNSLKDIAALLGFQWQGPVRFGIDSIVWRYRWEQTLDPSFQQALIEYNRDDCTALQRVAERLTAIAEEDPPLGRFEFASVSSVPNNPPRFFRRSAHVTPQIAQLIKCTYFDYQRKKVCFRTNASVRRSLRREQRFEQRVIKPTETIECHAPSCCPRCASHEVRKLAAVLRRTINDLRFTASGVKRWVKEYITHRYYCATCKKTFLSNEYPKEGKVNKCGHGLLSWAIYSHLALRISFEDFRNSLNDIFGYGYTWGLLASIKPAMAKQYRSSEEHIRKRLLASAAVYVDEKKIRIKGNIGYVWVFTNFEETLYLYSRTRDGTLVKTTLDGFSGVVVSDFYSVYDSLECPQQKCLAHLTRDINDGLLENPFDDEMAQIASGFTSLMVPIIETIDRFGLKPHFLKKHRDLAVRFLKEVCSRHFTSTPANELQKRFRKYGTRMFTFLEKEGVTWNNNAAENAIKLFASRWGLMGATHTEASIKDYLLFLSIYGTLRRKGASFLRFLLSKEENIDEFLGM